jgi:AsmA family protein
MGTSRKRGACRRAREPRSHASPIAAVHCRDQLFLGLVLVVVLGLTVMDWNRFKGPIERSASARFGRTVTIAGPLKVRFWSRTPTVTINDLSVGSPPWEANRPLLKVARVQFQLELLPSLLHAALVLRRVELDHPNIYLHQEKSGRANWTFENNAPTKQRATQPPRLPAMRDLVIDSGTLVLIDELRRLKVKGTVVAAEQASGKDSKPFRIQGKGTINDEPFRLDIAGGPLQALSPDEPYPFSLAIKAGENDVQPDGKLLPIPWLATSPISSSSGAASSPERPVRSCGSRNSAAGLPGRHFRLAC